MKLNTEPAFDILKEKQLKGWNQDEKAEFAGSAGRDQRPSEEDECTLSPAWSSVYHAGGRHLRRDFLCEDRAVWEEPGGMAKKVCPSGERDSRRLYIP